MLWVTPGFDCSSIVPLSVPSREREGHADGHMNSVQPSHIRHIMTCDISCITRKSSSLDIYMERVKLRGADGFWCLLSVQFCAFVTEVKRYYSSTMYMLG